MASSRFVSCAFLGLVACGSGGGFPDGKVIDSPPPGGRFSLAWTVTDQNGSAATCDQVGGASVSVTYHDPSVAGGNAAAFTCDTGMGTSETIPTGNYNVTIELVDTSGMMLGSATTQMGVAVGNGQTTALAPVTFSVLDTGNLRVHMNALQPGGNCGAKAAGGAGIIATTITLTNGSDGSCAPITFAVGSGSNTGSGSYTVDCANPVVGPCFEADQELDSLGMIAGHYTIHIQAFEDLTAGSGSGSGSGSAGPTACWLNNDQVVVPSNGRDLNDMLNLGKNGSGC